MKWKVLAFLIGIGLISIPPFYSIVSTAKANDIKEEADTASVIAKDVYDFSLSLKVPQVLDNTLSTGYRTFKPQKIKGKMYVIWLDDGTFTIEFSDLKNKNFKIRGVNVSYQGELDGSVSPRFNYIGNNNTGEFKTPCINFAILLEPSYAIGEATEDNSFILTLSAKGVSTFKKKLGSRIASMFVGSATGHQGCGCADYGHKSPTRKATLLGPGEETDDVVATWGTWRAVWKERFSYR